MDKKKKPRKKQPARPEIKGSASVLKNVLSLHDEMAQLKKDVQAVGGENGDLLDRIQDIEIHVNLLTRLLTTLCVEKFGMRVGVLKRMIKRIEKEAIRDSQILHLESLYNMPPSTDKKKDDTGKENSGDDPWEDIA